MTTTTMKPERPANLADVSTWTPAQLAYAAPLIIARAVAAASQCYAEAREYAADGSWAGRDAAAKVAKIGNRYNETVMFWQQVQLGQNPKVPVFLREQRVSSYQQTNLRRRPTKFRYAGPKDWGVWSR